MELTSPLAGIGYDVVMSDSGDVGMSFGLRAAGVNGGTITQWSIEYWSVEKWLEWFAGAQFEVFDKDVGIDDEPKFLGGARGGVRFDAMGAPLEVSGSYSYGTNGAAHGGVFLGVRIAG